MKQKMESLQSGDEKADEKKRAYCSVLAAELYFICCWCSLYFASNIIKVRQNLVAKPNESDILNA